MPQLKPVILELPESTTVTLNPSAFDNSRFTFVDSALTSISMKQRLTVKVRPAASNNTGHLVEATLLQPLNPDVPVGCCPITGAPPASSFNLRVLRGTVSSETEALKLYNELVAYVQTDDFKALVLGSSYY